MPNGDCPIGAAHTAEITDLRRRMDNAEAQQRVTCSEIEEIKVRRARLDGWSALLIAVITAVAAVAGPAIAAAIAARAGG